MVLKKWLAALAVILPVGLGSAQDLLSPQTEVDPVMVELSLGDGIASFIEQRYADSLDQLSNVPRYNAVASYYRGLSQLALQQPSEAINELARVVQQPNYPAEADLDMAVALVSAGREGEAIPYLQKYLATYPGDSVAQFFLGVANYRVGNLSRSRQALSQASQDASLRELCRPYLTAIEQSHHRAAFDSSDAYESFDDVTVAEPKPYNLTLLVGHEYDSNLTLSPNFSGLGDNIARKANRTTLALLGDVRLLDRDQYVTGLLGSAYGTFHHASETNDFNIQDYMLGAYHNQLMGCVIAGVRYEFHETLLQSTEFAQEHRLVANLTLLEGSVGHTTTYYEFDQLDVQLPALISAQDRSGPTNAVGVTQALYTMEGLGRVFFGYRYEDANADGTDFQRTTHQLNVSMEHPLGERCVVNVGSRIFWDDYHNPNSLDFEGRRRDDERSEARVGLQTFLTECLSARVDYTYTNSDSNVANLFGVRFYDYDRHLVSTQLIYDF